MKKPVFTILSGAFVAAFAQGAVAGTVVLKCDAEYLGQQGYRPQIIAIDADRRVVCISTAIDGYGAITPEQFQAFQLTPSYLNQYCLAGLHNGNWELTNITFSDSKLTFDYNNARFTVSRQSRHFQFQQWGGDRWSEQVKAIGECRPINVNWEFPNATF
jgi:hypothetical protein